MRIALTERFQKDVRDLDANRRAAVFDAILDLATAVDSPHLHAGLGLRKIHPSGIWEARIGLGLRMVLALEPGIATLVRVGSHDDVRRYLRTF